MRRLCLIVIWVVVLMGCSRKEDGYRYFVCVVDATASVTSEGQRASIEGIREAFRVLKRGDYLAIIPITGDAQIQGPGQILRFQVGEEREPYDGDLRRLTKQAEKQLKDLLASTLYSPYQNTDLLGTVALAAEELSIAKSGSQKMLLVLSDFIQDDDQCNFKRDSRLAREREAKAFAASLAGLANPGLVTVQVYLGSIRSKDLQHLSKSQRGAIRAFWTEYLVRQGATVRWATDGSGQLPRFLEQTDKVTVGAD